MPPVDKKKVCELDSKTREAFRHKGYLIETMLGAGSFGEVYKGKRLDNGLPCAVKMMNLDAMSERFKRRFLPRELTSLMEIKHKFIIRVWDIFKSKRKIYVFMEFAPNGDLASVLKQRGALKETQAHLWFTQTATALNFLHEEMYTAHRDIKIDNILLSETWDVRLTDFGFAVEAVDNDGNVVFRQTYCGTTPYYSPQIAAKHPYDPFSADVWALGVVLFAMTHNKFPFHFRESTQMIKEQNDIDYKLSRLDRNLSKDLKDLVLAMFEFDENKRPTFRQVLKHRWVVTLADKDD